MSTPLFRPEAVAHQYDASSSVLLEHRPWRIGVALAGALLTLLTLIAWLALYDVVPGHSLLSWLVALIFSGVGGA